MTDLRTIVSEVSKTWPNGDATPLAMLFERVIAVNQGRGYELASWRFSQAVHPAQDEGTMMVETIVAVFERTSRAEGEG